MNYSSKNLNDAQRTALKEFRRNLKDVLNPDYTDAILYKWLKARNFDVKAAEKIFREMYNNRILFGVNTILDTYDKPEVAEKYETVGVIGFAKDGSLIRYTGAGRLDFYGFIMSMSCYELCLYFSHMMESDLKRLKEENLRTGRKVNEVTFILDLEGFHIQQVLHKNVIEMGLDFTRLLQDCYPDIWSYVLIVNAPSIFDKAFTIFKPVLHSNTLERIRVVDKSSTRELLLKYIDENVLPVFLGGKRVDTYGDPKCKEFLKFGGKVPESLYSLNQMSPLQPTDPGVRIYNIGARAACNYSVAVWKGSQNYRYEAISDGSLTVSVFHREFDDEDQDDPEFPNDNEYLDDTDENCRYKMISVAIRAQMHCAPVDGLIFLPKPGIYVFRISNINSWFSSRKLLMRVNLVPPTSVPLT